MGWIERLWRNDGRVKATPSSVATLLADSVTRSTNLLRVRLDVEVHSRDDRKRFESEACVLECLLFEWFLRDLIVGVEFGRDANVLRETLARRLAEDLDRSGLSPAVLLDFTRLRHKRFAEYEEAAGVSISLQTLGNLAWRRIADTDGPSDRMTMFLSIRATAELQALRGLGKRYLLLVPPRSFFSSPSEV
jgi:hypothetical protein